MNQITQSQRDPVAINRATKPENPSVRVPAVNIHQDANGYTLVVEMPGVAKSGVDVTFEDGKLVLTGRRESPVSAAQALHREIQHTNYRRVFDLDPSIDASRIDATIDQGLLTVSLPKAEAAKPRKIEVR